MEHYRCRRKGNKQENFKKVERRSCKKKGHITRMNFPGVVNFPGVGSIKF